MTGIRPQFNAVQLLPDHPGFVSSLVFSKDGRRLFAGTFINQVKIWDWVEPVGDADEDEEDNVGKWEHKQTLTCKSTSKRDKFTKSSDTPTIKALALSPDDSFLAVGSIDKNFRVYQTAADGSYQEAQCVKTKACLLDNEIGYLAISPDGKYLVAATAETGNKVFLYRRIMADKTFSFLEAVKANDFFGNSELPFIRALDFAPDGRFAIAISRRANVSEVGTGNGPVLDPAGTLLEVEEGTINALAFSSDGFYIAIVTDSGSLRVFGKLQLTLQMVTDSQDAGVGLSSVAFSPDGKLLVAGGIEGNLYVWRRGAKGEDMDDWVFATSVEVEGSDSMSLAFQPGDGQVLVTGQMGAAHVWKYEV